MKRILAIILVILMVAGMLASCGKPASNKETEASTDPVVETPSDTEGEDTSDDEEYVEEGDEEEEEEEEEEGECDHEGGDDATCISESICDLCDEPYGGFDPGNHEGDEEWESDENGHKLVYSCCGEVTEEESAHNYVNGVCTDCEFECAHANDDGHSCTECLAFVKHSYSNNKCTICGIIRNGKTVTFGSYPQTKVISTSLISTLNSKAGSPTSWDSYGYTENATMRYIDIEEGGQKYRGVYFTSYRPTDINNPASTSNSQQDDHGYALNKAHWFKYEPITWTILTEDTAAKKAFVLCNMILDAQAFDTNGDNNYEDSTIRQWLNEDFLNTAFSDLQQAIVVTTLVENDDNVIGDYSNGNKFFSSDTEDKIFLISKGEVKNASYGFSGNSDRKMTVTDYAKSQGAYADANNGDWWWMRTPSYDSSRPDKSDLAHNLKVDGSIWSSNVYLTSGGVVPAMWVYI